MSREADWSSFCDALEKLLSASRVDPVTLVAILQKSVLSRIADHEPANLGFQKIV